MVEGNTNPETGIGYWTCRLIRVLYLRSRAGHEEAVLCPLLSVRCLDVLSKIWRLKMTIQIATWMIQKVTSIIQIMTSTIHVAYSTTKIATSTIRRIVNTTKNCEGTLWENSFRCICQTICPQSKESNLSKSISHNAVRSFKVGLYLNAAIRYRHAVNSTSCQSVSTHRQCVY